MRTREIASLHRSVGEIGGTLAGTLSVANVAPTALMLGRLRHVAERGVDLFDLTFAREPAAWEALLSETFRGAVPPPARLTPLRREMTLTGNDRPRTGAWNLEEELPLWLSERRERLPDGIGDALMIPDPSMGAWEAVGKGQSLARAIADGAIASWGVAWSDPGRAAEEIPRAIEAGARIVGVPYNLLEPVALARHAMELRKHGMSTIVHDPFAGGRLDGSWLRDGRLGGPAGNHAPALAELHDRFDPVTRLGFLTHGRRRTLPQAAVQVALATPSVAVVAVPISPPELLDSVAGLEGVLPLSDEEWEEWSRSIPGLPGPTSRSNTA